MEFGLIGEHLGHSFSKDIHESVAGYRYELKEIPKGELDAFMRAKSFKAINVTIPYKEDVLPYLDEISPLAKRVGAVNCIINESGRLLGFNTDVLGFEEQLHHMGLLVQGKTVAVLGDGGASKAVRVALEQEGAKEVYIVSRKDRLGTISYSELRKKDDVQIIVNTTPVGMFPNNDDTIIELDDFPSLEGFADVVYNPLRTMSVLSAKKKGIPSEGGLYMLVAQAVKAIELFLGKSFPSQTIEKEYLRLMGQRHNIVLIGMPSSGKSTLGKRLAKEMGLPFLDTDKEIVKEINMPIADYFAQFGENAFRDKESEVIQRISKTSPMVIATGGGVVLRKENVNRLKQNGTLYFIDRKLSLLESTADRPLSSNFKDLCALYEYRLPIYQEAADHIIPNNRPIEEAISSILKEERK